MFPLYDDIPSRRFPLVTITIIVITGAVFYYQLQLANGVDELFQHAGVVPARFIGADPLQKITHSPISTLITYMFLHGGWLHILGNMWMMWIFGDNVEDRLGRMRFLIFYLSAGIISALAHVFFNPTSTLPTVGASGAIAGVMGAYFLLFPKARVVTAVPIFIFIQIIKLPAFVFLGIWFGVQFLMGSMQQRSLGGGGIAWWAHIGGFVAGILLVTTVFRPRTKLKVASRK